MKIVRLITPLAFAAVLVPAPLMAAPAKSRPAARPAAAPADVPKPLSRDAALAPVAAQFKQFDADGDGFVTAEEIDAAEAKAREDMLAKFETQRRAEFDKADANKDGTLTYDEFKTLTSPPEIRTRKGSTVIGQFDKDGDGKISPAEFAAPRAAQFDRLDTNKDGVLSPAEQAGPRRTAPVEGR